MLWDEVKLLDKEHEVKMSSLKGRQAIQLLKNDLEMKQ